MRAVEVLTDAVSVLEMASAGADGVVVAVVDEEVAVLVSFVGGVVVAVCVGGCSGSGSGSGAGVASVVKVSSPVIAAVPLESMIMTR